ncbi:MAG: histidine phosphatase family protein [Myxococcales bacterium]|nr:histidine phosphatase family protein [Myxococcales bacterium]
MQLYLVRHGQTRWNVERRLQGRTDSPLTLLGLRQVRAYAERLREMLGDAEVELCASPLPRTRQTASLLVEILELSSERYSESELLAERYCGDWEGQKLDELIEVHGEEVRAQWKRWDAVIGGDGETLAQVQSRARAWLDSKTARRPIVVVTHGVMSRQFRGAYLQLDPEATMALESHGQDRIYRLEDGAITTLEVDPLAAEGI